MQVLGGKIINVIYDCSYNCGYIDVFPYNWYLSPIKGKQNSNLLYSLSIYKCIDCECVYQPYHRQTGQSDIVRGNLFLFLLDNGVSYL